MPGLRARVRVSHGLGFLGVQILVELTSISPTCPHRPVPLPYYPTTTATATSIRTAPYRRAYCARSIKPYWSNSIVVGIILKEAQRLSTTTLIKIKYPLHLPTRNPPPTTCLAR